MFLQKSFMLRDGRLTTLKSGHEIKSFNVESIPGIEFGATVDVNYWFSLTAPDALCSFATEPCICAVIETSDIIRRKGPIVYVSNYRIFGMAPEDPADLETLRNLDLGIDVFSNQKYLKECRIVAKRRAVKKFLKNRK